MIMYKQIVTPTILLDLRNFKYSVPFAINFQIRDYSCVAILHYCTHEYFVFLRDWYFVLKTNHPQDH